MGPDPRSPASSSRYRRSHRLGSLVRRWEQRPGEPGGGGSRKKGGPNEPEDHALGRSRGGFGSKLHLVTDGNGLPLSVEVTAGQRHESTQFEAVLDAVRIPQPHGRPRQRPAAVAGDKGYSYPRIRHWLRRHAIHAVIPMRSDQASRHCGRPPAFDKDAYRGRSVIECCIGWLKECRRIGTRFEKLARTYLAMVKVAILQRYLRLLFADRT
jgi:transposase